MINYRGYTYARQIKSPALVAQRYKCFALFLFGPKQQHIRRTKRFRSFVLGAQFRIYKPTALINMVIMHCNRLSSEMNLRPI